MNQEKIIYLLAEHEDDLRDILSLQQLNLKQALSPEETRSEGYVTVKHDLALLRALNSPYRHVLARSGDVLAGYALVMERRWKHEIEVLIPMFDEIDAQRYQGVEVKSSKYFVMGQVCVAPEFRGKGIFRGLYAKMKSVMSSEFDFLITEIASDNQRSLNAHLAIGFEEFHRYPSGKEFDWILVIQDYR